VRAWIGLVTVGAVACRRHDPPPPTPPIVPIVAAPADAAVAVDARPSGHNVYGLAEALDDAYASPWTFVGTGDWFGLFRINACVYKNDRVFIINHYCTGKEMSSAGVVVISPTRGRVYIYAEGKAPISQTRRDAWMSFKADANLPTDPPPRLDFTYAELRAWDEKRYYVNSPGCFGGVEANKPLHDCYRLVAAQEDWHARNAEFLREPPEIWYRIVRDMRTHAKTDARPYKDPPKP
jgi:hypothetical protein